MSNKRPLAPDDPRHGTANGYGNLGCRCDACREANTISHMEWVRRSHYNVPMDEWNRLRRTRYKVHGTEGTYKTCKCDACRYASMIARRRRRAAEKERGDNTIGGEGE
jgi:hypothetical protein